MSTQDITPSNVPLAWHIGARTQRKRGVLVTTYEILDNNGSIVAELPEDFHSHREQDANAELICKAVNGRSYLLGLCGRLAQRLQQARLEGFGLPNEEPLLREAALAIREAAK